jgi:8-oxo-dGTP pyrophosphatase MutT (NUDIX family)
MGCCEGMNVGELPFERVVSAGGVIFRRVNAKFEVALILHKGNWCLPKGLVEENETFEQTALREVREETGLNGELVDKIGEISYSFVQKKRYFKTVHFYLLKLVGGSTDLHDSEAYRVKWFSIFDALQILTYVKEREILAKAIEMLRKMGNL